MSKLLILTLLLTVQAFGSPSFKKAVKEPSKAFKTATVRLSKPYIQSYASSEVLLRVQPKDLKNGKKFIGSQCQKHSLSCSIFQDSQQSTLLNISIYGKTSNIKKLLLWTKANSLTYSENHHKKK